MSSYIPKQPKRERDQISIRLDRDVLRRLEQYGRFLDSSRDYIINAALELVFRKDKAFAAWPDRASVGRGCGSLGPGRVTARGKATGSQRHSGFEFGGLGSCGP